MGVSPVINISIGTVVLTAVLVSGCKKPPFGATAGDTNTVPVVTNAAATLKTNAAPAVTNASPAPVHSRGKDLGVIQFTNRCELQLQVGDGKSCTFKPLLLDPQRLQLTMTLESKMADGKTRGLKIMTVVAKPNQAFEVDFGSLVFTLTPQLVTPAP